MGELLTPIRLLSHRLSGGVRLSRAETDALGSIAQPGRRFGRGETVVRQGDRLPYVILTAGGWAFREKSLRDGRRQILAIMLPGELSEKGPLMPFGAPDTIVAATDLDTQSIDRRALVKAMETHPRILQAFLFEETSRHIITREWVLLLGRRNAAEKVAYLLYETYARLRAMGTIAEADFDFPITQQDLGDITGMSTVHVNRTLQMLRAKGLLIWENRRVRLPDPPALAHLAKFDTSFERMGQDFANRAADSFCDRHGPDAPSASSSVAAD